MQLREPSNCPTCAPDLPASREVLEQGDYRLVACERCGLVRLTPLLDTEGMAAIVEKSDYHYGGEIDWGRTYDWEELSRTSALRNAMADHERLKALVRRMAKPVTGPLRVHDIGCSEGFSLALGRREGWACSGNDLSPLRRDFGRRNLGVELTLGAFGEVDTGPLDVVVMRHVLEHLRDPVQELSLVRERLVPRGLLVVEVPNFAAPSLRFKVWRQRRGLRRRGLGFLGVPEHQWQFTARTLGALLGRAGLDVVSAGTASRYLNHGVVVRALVTQTAHRLGLGSHLVMVARKAGRP